MKLLYYSSDNSEVAQVGKEFSEAGIACEVRPGEGLKLLHQPACAELWIRHDRDCHRALMLCVQLGVGFARRSGKKSFIESWSEISTGSAPSPDGTDETVEKEAEYPEEVHPMHRVRRARAA
jgi:hypothetical protein